MIGVIEECRMELLPYRSVEDAYAARFLATGVIGMTEKWITSRSHPEDRDGQPDH